MTRSMAHRGPDDEGTEVLGQIGLGHRRLAVLDLSPLGRQPMTNEHGDVWVVFNGEIYNYISLRDGLRHRHHFRSATDTEVLLHVYEDCGDALVDVLDGMFAFAIADLRRQRILLARDPFGIKPLYYALNERCLTFASELKPFLFSGETTREIDVDALNDFFDFFWIPAPRSIFRDVAKLLPAHVLTLDLRTWQHEVKCYWRPEYRPEFDRSDAFWLSEIARHLDDSVRAQMVSDVPLGAFLSGGIDSSLATYYAAKFSSSPLTTFTIDFAGGDHSEVSHANRIAAQLSCNSVARTLAPASLAELPRLAAFFDEPFADSSLIPTSLVSRVAREHVTVAISGDGGDELFAGYRHHTLARKISCLDWIPPSLARALFGTLAEATSPESRVHQWGRRLALPPDDRRLSLARLPARGSRIRLLAEDLRHTEEARYWFLKRSVESLRGLPAVTQAQFFDLMFYLPSDMLVKVDRASMACGLEVRVPFLTRSIAELAFRIPEDKRSSQRELKPLLRRLAATLFGSRHAQRPKSGFSIPRRQWLREAASVATEDMILGGHAVRAGYLSKQEVAALFANIRRGRPSWYDDRSEELFAVLVFEAWWDQIMIR